MRIKYLLLILLLIPSLLLAVDIEYDNHSEGYILSDTDITVSHSTAGSDRVMVIGVGVPNLRTVTSIDYNGQTPTLVSTNTASGFVLRSYILINPDAGTHDVSVTINTADSINVHVSTYKNVHQVTQPDNSTTANFSDSPMTTTLETLRDRTWTVLFGAPSSVKTITASTNSTQRGSGLANSFYAFDSNGFIGSSGNYSMTQTATLSGASYATVMLSLSPKQTTSTLSFKGNTQLKANTWIK